jgi:hypothetical protein
MLKQIFLDKEHELTVALSKVDELTKQLDQLRKIKLTTTKEQSQNKNELDKLKQELMVSRSFFSRQQRVDRCSTRHETTRSVANDSSSISDSKQIK